jgi:glycosyltransferase involved in cell wall biosynthesis
LGARLDPPDALVASTDDAFPRDRCEEPPHQERGTLILAIIPAHNEAAHIAPVVAETRAHLPALVVDDGSTDATAAVAEAAGATVWSQSPNQGKGAALVTGFRWACERAYDAVVMLDGDGQHDPAEIPTFLKAYSASHADLIIGARDFRHMPLVRRVSNTMGRLIFSWALRQHVPDNQSGYRLVSRRLMQATLVSPERGFEFEMDMIVVAARSGFRLKWVPIRTIYAGESSHIRKWHHLVNFLRVAWHARRG